MSRVYVLDLSVRLVRDEHVQDLSSDPSFMKGQCETKPLLLAPVFVVAPAFQEGKTHLIVKGRHRYLGKSRGLSVKDLADTRVLSVELPYRDNPSRVLTEKD